MFSNRFILSKKLTFYRFLWQYTAFFRLLLTFYSSLVPVPPYPVPPSPFCGGQIYFIRHFFSLLPPALPPASAPSCPHLRSVGFKYTSVDILFVFCLKPYHPRLPRRAPVFVSWGSIILYSTYSLSFASRPSARVCPVVPPSPFRGDQIYFSRHLFFLLPQALPPPSAPSCARLRFVGVNYTLIDIFFVSCLPP